MVFHSCVKTMQREISHFTFKRISTHSSTRNRLNRSIYIRTPYWPSKKLRVRCNEITVMNSMLDERNKDNKWFWSVKGQELCMKNIIFLVESLPLIFWLSFYLSKLLVLNSLHNFTVHFAHYRGQWPPVLRRRLRANIEGKV